MRYQGETDQLGFPIHSTVIFDQPTPISPQELAAMRQGKAESPQQKALRKRADETSEKWSAERRLLAAINAARERVKQKPFTELPADVRAAIGLPALPQNVVGGSHVLAAVNAIRSAAGLRELTADEIPPKLRSADIEKLLEQTLALSVDADTNVNRASRAEAHRLADSISAWPISDTNPLLADASRRAAKANQLQKGR